MERLASVRARLQEWERAFARLHGRRPAQVRWGWGHGQGGEWELRRSLWLMSFSPRRMWRRHPRRPAVSAGLAGLGRG